MKQVRKRHSNICLFGFIFIFHVLRLFLFLLFSDVEVNELSFFPVFRPFLTVGLDELALSVPHVVLVGAGEDVAGAEGVLTLALLNTVSPLAFIAGNRR